MSEGFLAVLLSVSLSGACLLGAAEGITLLLRGNVSPNIRKALWCLVLLRLLCPWSPSGGLLDRAVRAQEQVIWESPEPSEVIVDIPMRDASATAGREEQPFSWERGLVLLWELGACTVLGRRGMGYARLYRALSRTQRPAGRGERTIYAKLTVGEARPPRLMISPSVPCPMLIGLFRTRIVLPEGVLSREELEGVLAHELTHWRRKDLWLKWMAALAAAVHWFNPAVWHLAQRLDRDCELACDRAVVHGWDQNRRTQYGELLLRLAAGERSPCTTLFSQKQRLKERLTAIMEQKTYGKRAAAMGAAACLALLLTSTALGIYTGPAAVEEKLSDLSAGTGLEAAEPPAMLAWPLEVGDTVQLSQLFPGRIHPITGERREHGGLDIPQPAGTPVLAAADGVVLEAEFSPSEGSYVLLQHGTMTTKYAHLQEYSVTPGQEISTGDPIGLVGRSGMATGNHLHFEVAVDGVREDPLNYLDGSVNVQMGGSYLN